MSIILVRHVCLKGLATPQYSPMSNLMLTLIALMHVDETDLNILCVEGESASEVIDLCQRMLDAWKFDLSVSGYDLKLDKCSWTIKYYYWNEGHFLLNLLTPYQLNVTLNVIKHPLELILPNENMTLIGASVNPDNETK